MRPRRIPLALSAAALVTLLIGAPAAAAGSVPGGHGLIKDLTTLGYLSLTCDDPSVALADVSFPRGGGTATWVADGRMYVVLSLDVTGTVTVEGSSFPVGFSVDYGAKRGLTDIITCTFEQRVESEVEVFEGTGTVVLARVW